MVGPIVLFSTQPNFSVGRGLPSSHASLLETQCQYFAFTFAFVTTMIHVGRLKEELKTANELKRQLRCELASSRRDMDAMLETLRRKERQFADERKQLEKKNKELSSVFDLFAERSGLAQRRHKCIAAKKDQLHDAMMSCRISDDVSTQTDDDRVADTPAASHDNTVQVYRNVQRRRLIAVAVAHAPRVMCSTQIITQFMNNL